MATRRSDIYFQGDHEIRENPISAPPNTQFEFDESDVWDSTELVTAPEPRKPTRPTKTKPALWAVADRRSRAASSVPVNIPDWSKILRDEERESRRRENEEIGDDGDGDGDGRMPPHEYLARTRMASLSVHEGIGRTLKGRDLSRVRNAIWKQTGFED